VLKTHLVVLVSSSDLPFAAVDDIMPHELEIQGSGQLPGSTTAAARILMDVKLE
jgi:hypothetical protein